jgi:hypothetical protein
MRRSERTKKRPIRFDPEVKEEETKKKRKVKKDLDDAFNAIFKVAERKLKSLDLQVERNNDNLLAFTENSEFMIEKEKR